MIDYAAALRARRRLASWISENGRQDASTCRLIDVLEDLDKALDVSDLSDAAASKPNEESPNV